MGRSFIDCSGQKFGLLTVISIDRSKRNCVAWLCRCDCGGTKIVESSNLRLGKISSCGCIHKYKGKQNRKYSGFEDISGDFWTSLKHSASSRHHRFNITIEYAWNLFVKQDRKCALSGLSIDFGEPGRDKRNTRTASIDRIDSSKGYVEGNIQWVHRDINLMKNVLDQKRFVEMCIKVAEYTKEIDK